MPTKPIYVYGASGHGKVVADILLACRQHVAGFIDDFRCSEKASLLGIPVVGNGEWLVNRALRQPLAVALGIGDNAARKQVAERCVASGIQPVNAIHPSATIAPSAQLGWGTVAMAGVTVNADARVGCGVILNTGSIVEHDCTVGDYAHLSPHAAMGGGARLGELSWLGMSAVVIHGTSVGANAIIGAGAVIIGEIPGSVVAVGVPARIVRKQV